jgi:hypothetical protein
MFTLYLIFGEFKEVYHDFFYQKVIENFEDLSILIIIFKGIE